MLLKIRQLIKRALFRPVIRVPVYVPTLECNLLKGRTALITGASSGIGYSIAEAFIRSGARVLITRRKEQKLNAAVTMLGSNARGVVSNAENIDDIPNLLNQVGCFDILVNNVGVTGGDSVLQVTHEKYDQVLDTNLRGTLFLSQKVAECWKRDGVKGNILNICSTSSIRPATTPYAISKWGLRGLTVGLAKELVKYDIVVNGLAPGQTSTTKFVPDKAFGIDNLSNPSKRFVTEEEVAAMAVVLVSDISRMVVGDVVYMGGGAGIITFDDI